MVFSKGLLTRIDRRVLCVCMGACDCVHVYVFFYKCQSACVYNHACITHTCMDVHM